MASDLLLSSLTVRGFRNISELVFEPGARVNIISGDNGQGKTSLLEAIYWVCTTRSFRTERIVELRQTSADVTLSDARLVERGLTRAQRAVFSAEGRRFLLDDKPPKRLRDYAVTTPIVVFQPGDLRLVTGPASERRTLLDRIGLFVDPVSFDHRQRFQEAARARQRTLDVRGVNAPELGAFEELMAHHGAELEQARVRVVKIVEQVLEPIFRRLADRALRLALELELGGPIDAAELRARLESSRALDQRRKSTGVGPHRDDLVLRIDDQPARRRASQGQQRILVLALKMAELDCLRSARGVDPLLLLDDVSSELDPARSSAVLEFLRSANSQIFVTTTRPELFQAPKMDALERRDFRLERGRLIP